jgi:hypothetical protein
MIARPPESRIADGDIDGDASVTGQYEGSAFMIDAPTGARSRGTGLALQQEFYDSICIGLKHHASKEGSDYP